MNQAIKIKTASPFTRRHCLRLLLVLGFLALCQSAQAVTPAPDGGYPGFNTAEGQNALFSRTTGVWNTAVGAFSLYSDATANGNTGVGINTLRHNVNGDSNTAVGLNALFFNDGGPTNGTGSENTALGAYALFQNTTGSNNTALGGSALSRSVGSQNTAVGDNALVNSNLGGGNTAVGESAGYNITTANNVICIGAYVAGADVDNSCFIGNIREVATVNANAIPVVIDSAGQLGTASSSRRFKKEIKPMDKASEAILALKPVTFHYKSDKANSPQFGLIAEEVAKVNPDLVVHDEKGEIYTVRYDAVNAMLLNEFLKEHKAFLEEQRKMAEQGAIIAKQQKQIEALTAGFQRVSAQIERNKPTPKVVLNNP
jgi:hypothetical protein